MVFNTNFQFSHFSIFFWVYIYILCRDIIWIELESTGNLTMVMNERVS